MADENKGTIELRVDFKTQEGTALAEKFKRKFGKRLIMVQESGEFYETPSVTSGGAYIRGYENVRRYFLGFND